MKTIIPIQTIKFGSAVMVGGKQESSVTASDDRNRKGECTINFHLDLGLYIIARSGKEAIVHPTNVQYALPLKGYVELPSLTSPQFRDAGPREPWADAPLPAPAVDNSGEIVDKSFAKVLKTDLPEALLQDDIARMAAKKVTKKTSKKTEA